MPKAKRNAGESLADYKKRLERNRKSLLWKRSHKKEVRGYNSAWYAKTHKPAKKATKKAAKKSRKPSPKPSVEQTQAAA